MLTGGSGQVLWTCTGRKTLPPSASLPVIGEIAGVNTTSLGGHLYSTKTRARWAEGFHNELNGHVFDLERDGFRQAVLCPRHTMRRQHTTIPYRMGRRSGQQGLRLPPYTRTEVSICYWCIIEDSSKRQHHHRHLEHKDTKNCWETSRTNTRNGQVQMEHPWTL